MSRETISTVEGLFDALGICGCSDTEEAIKFVREYLRACAGPDVAFDKQKTLLCGDSDWTPMAYLFLGSMDRLGLITHGTGVRCSWLTDEGETLLAALTDEAIDKFERELGGEE